MENKRIRIDQPINGAVATIVDQGFVTSSEKGTPGFFVDFVFDDLQGENNEEVYIRHTFWLTDNTFEYFVRDLTTIGWHGKNIFELDKNQPDYTNLVGLKASLVIEMNDYKGKMRPVVKFINEPGATAKGMESSEVKNISERFKAKLLSYRQKNGSENKPKVEAKKIKTEDKDGVPF